MSKIIGKLGPKFAALTKSGIEVATPKLQTFMTYAKVELVPPTPAEIGPGIAGIVKVMKTGMSGGFMKKTVHEAWINTLIGVEITCWFFIGECIGKRSLCAYQV